VVPSRRPKGETRAVRRRHCVGGGARIIFSEGRRRAAGPKKSAAFAAKKFLFKESRKNKISRYPQKGADLDLDALTNRKPVK